MPGSKRGAPLRARADDLEAERLREPPQLGERLGELVVVDVGALDGDQDGAAEGSGSVSCTRHSLADRATEVERLTMRSDASLATLAYADPP